AIAYSLQRCPTNRVNTVSKRVATVVELIATPGGHTPQFVSRVRIVQRPAGHQVKEVIRYAIFSALLQCPADALTEFSFDTWCESAYQVIYPVNRCIRFG